MVLDSISSRRISNNSGLGGVTGIVMGGCLPSARAGAFTHVSARFYNVATEAPILQISQGLPHTTFGLTGIHSFAARNGVCRCLWVRKAPLRTYLQSAGDDHRQRAT